MRSRGCSSIGKSHRAFNTDAGVGERVFEQNYSGKSRKDSKDECQFPQEVPKKDSGQDGHTFESIISPWA